MNEKPHVTQLGKTENENSQLLFVENILARAHHLPQGEPGTYGATPLNRLTTLNQQVELGYKLQRLTTHIDKNTPMEIAAYVHDTFLSRFNKRGEANEHNYISALHTKDEFNDNPILMGVFERAELGLASPSELLITRQVLGIRSVELACLTHPYGDERLNEFLEPMREAVEAHVELFGRAYTPDPEPRYRVKEVVLPTDDATFAMGLLMTRKRKLATLSDGTIVRERSSFVLRLTDNPLIDEACLVALRSVDPKDKDFQSKMVEVARLDEIVSGLLEMDEFDLAIPLSTTIYAYNPATAKSIKERDYQQFLEKRAVNEPFHPELSAARRAFEMAGKYVEVEEGGMLYVGPKQS